MWIFPKEPDRYDKNESDGQVFVGFDHDDGLQIGTLPTVNWIQRVKHLMMTTITD